MEQQKKILFIYNPVSGKGAVKSKLSYIIESISRMGIVTAIPTRKKGDATRYVKDYMEQHNMVICSGGDGTLNEVTTGYMSVDRDKRKPCGYIPSGTVNDFATSLGLSKNITKCTDSLADSTPFPYDIGEFNDKYFTYIAGFGAFTQVAYSTSQNVKNILGKTAYILEGIKSLPKIKGINVTLIADDKEIKGKFIYGMICNTFSVGGILKIDHEDIALDDGMFEAIFVREFKNPIELQETINGILLGKTDNSRIIRLRGDKFKIICENEIPWTLDGEFGGNYKNVEITNHPVAIEFLKPKNSKSKIKE